MVPRSLQALFCLWLSTVLASTAIASEAGAGATVQSEPGYIKVKDISIAGLLRTTADMSNVNVVAATPENARASIEFGYSTPQGLLERLAFDIGMRLDVQHGRIAVIHSDCQKVPTAIRGISVPQSVSLNFQELSLGLLLEIFELHIDPKDKTTSILARQQLSLRIRDVSGSEILKAAAFALSLDMFLDDSGKVRLAHSVTSMCAAPDTDNALESDSDRRRVWSYSDSCPYRRKANEPNARRCDPLEYFSLRTLVPMGYLQWKGRRYAYVESLADGEVHGVKAGDYVGRNYGKVRGISAEGLDIREIFQDLQGEWQEWPTTLSYGSRYMPSKLVRNNDYIHKDSAQDVYDTAVSDLFVFRDSVPHTSRLCRRFHPASMGTIEKAIADWERRYDGAIQAISKHGAAYAERIAEDYVVSFELVMREAHHTAGEFLSKYLSVMGGFESASVKSYCEKFPALLKSDAMNLEVRFKQELLLLQTCQEASTCPNL